MPTSPSSELFELREARLEKRERLVCGSYTWKVRGVSSPVVHAIRAVRLLARDGRIPRPLRGLVAIGVLPIPGPVDEAVLLVAAVLLFSFYREPMREAWTHTRADAPGAY